MSILGRKYISFIHHFDLKMTGRTLLYISLSLFTSTCIEPYIADIDKVPSLISIEGSIIKGDSIQYVTVSRTSTLFNPQYNAIEGCEVKVVDDLNNEFIFRDISGGRYALAIPDESLACNHDYRLVINSPDGHIYESQYENLTSSVVVDSVYYDIEERITAYTENDFKGLQFYVDVKAADTVSRYFRWKLESTYEYTTTGPISYIYRVVNGELEKYVPPNKWESYRCWITEKVPGIFIPNTINLSVNEKKRIPLNFVSNKSDRLKIKYSLLVNQYTMNEGAYNYWQLNKTAIEESAGLYTSQPGKVLSNISCSNDAEESVLGYFWVSSKTEHRIFIPRIHSLVVYDQPCEIYRYDP